MKSENSNPWIRLAWFLIGILSASLAIQPAIVEDTWWHLAVGRWMLENNSTPDQDPFSQLGQSTPTTWKAYSWLYELLLIKTYHKYGLDGILHLKLVLSALSVMSLCRYISQTSRTVWSAILIAFVATPAFWPMLNERPWHMSIVGVICTLSVLDRCLARVTSLREVGWLLPVYVVWANVHIQFILGLGLIILAVLILWIRHRRTQQVSSLATLLILLISCFMMTLINPYHVKLYVVIWEYATQTGAMEIIEELKSPSINDYWTWSLIVVTCWACFNVIRFGLPIWETCLLLAGLFFAIRCQRDVWFGVLLALRAGNHAPAKSPKALSALQFPFAGLCLMKLLWISGLVTKEPIQQIIEKRYPVLAVEWINTHHPTGPMFNTLDWGGYLIWNLPNYPVSMDGRTNMYGDDALRTHLATWKDPTVDITDPRFSKYQLVIAPKLGQNQELPLITKLRTAWQIAHEDSISIVFTRPEPPNQR